jgi:F420H2 dehydrogenase subunit N
MMGSLPSPALSVIILISTFVAVVLLDALHKRRHIKTAAIIGMVAALLPLLFLPASGTIALFRVDLFTLFFAVIALSIGALITISSQESTAAYNGSVILSVIGMVLAASADDLILLYLSIELVTAPTYVLVAYHKTTKRMEAATKYFIVGIVASALLLFGLALLASAGTTRISAISFSTEPLFLLGLVAVTAGLGFKLGIFPFNFWIPDVYQGAPAEIAGLLAGASKKAAYAAFLRIAVIFAALHSWPLLFAVLAALTMTIPNLIALLQTDVRRLLAYSIMSHAGFLLMGLAAATAFGYTGLLFHAFTHAFMALGAFLVLGMFMTHHIESIEQLKGMGWRNKFLGIALTIFLLSLAGIPLLAGFASKLYLFYATVDAGVVWLAVLAIVNSVISLYYYFRIIRAMYAYPSGGHAYRIRNGTLIAIIICLAVTIIAGVYPQPFIRFAELAVQALA